MDRALLCCLPLPTFTVRLFGELECLARRELETGERHQTLQQLQPHPHQVVLAALQSLQPLQELHLLARPHAELALAVAAVVPGDPGHLPSSQRLQ